MAKRFPDHIMDKLRLARSFAAFERAGFSFSGDTVTVKRLHGKSHLMRANTGNGTHDLTAFVKAETAAYRETWLIPLIDELLEYGRGD